MAVNIGDTVYVVANTGTDNAQDYTGMSGTVVDIENVNTYPYVIQTEDGIIVCRENELSADPAE